MKTVRHAVFETNSSSTHSISINSDTELYGSITPDENGVITLTGGRFGWEWKRYNDCLTKANYCAIDSDGSDEKRNMLREVIMEHTGASDVVFQVTTSYKDDEYSYIDHQSVGTSHPTFSSKENLKNFIFNRNSYLFTGNDNDYEPANFYDVDVTKFTHKLKLEGTNDLYKLTDDDLRNNDKIMDAILNLYARNKHNEYSSERSFDYNDYVHSDGGSYEKQKYFHINRDDENRGIDFGKKTLTVERGTYVYKKDGKFDKYLVDERLELKYTIEKL